MHTPPKSFHPSVDKTDTRREKNKTRGICERRNEHTKEEISIQNMTEKRWRNIHYKDYRE